MSLEEQLNRLHKSHKLEKREINNGVAVYVKEYTFPLILGKYRLEEHFTLDKITKITLPEGRKLEAREILFFDTETTGLSSGTGTIPFLVGFGYFTDGGFVTKQFFLKSPSREYEMLSKINDLIEEFHCLASYNGRGFDSHILETRFILNRMGSKLTDMQHIDLLYPSRAFFRQYLGSASLQDVERGIFGYTRTGDIPGALIPYVYFDFLNNGNEEKINTVIEHNRYDILSLAFIIKILDELMCDPAKSPHDLISLSTANYLKNKRMNNEAKSHFENLIQSTTNSTLQREAKKNLSMLLKKEDIQKASVLWEEEKDELYAIIELAKYHEHKTKKIDVALEITKRGLNKCNTMIELGDERLRGVYENLLKRERRLIRKLRRKPNA